jgi:hypothetical protein
MKILFYTIAITLLLSSCKKDVKIKENILLTGQPLSVMKAYTTGSFKVRFQIIGFTGSRLPVDSQYVFITKDSMIWIYPWGTTRSKYTWIKTTDLQKRKTYAMDSGMFGTIFPDAVSDGLLSFGYNIVDGGGYLLERK